ncbi:MAG TPA: phosphotransferase [Acidimicrobiia bacterium]|nr:phosphotransferase [Acidimicrobiia bacterium]
MTSSSQPPPATLPHPEEEAWAPELRLLLGPDAAGLLAAVAETAGGTLVSWRPRQVSHQPGRSTAVQYRAGMRWANGDTTSETFVAATGDRVPAEGAAIFEDGSTRVGVWRWPQDPFLPGLSDALDSAKVGSLLDDLGIDGGAVRLRTRGYRPGRRAVVEATGRRGRLFLKVVRPERIEALHDRHRSLAQTLPVPESLGWSEGGVLVLTALHGDTLRAALRSSRHPAPPPENIVSLLDRLPAELAQASPRRDLLSSARHHGEIITATVPGAADRVEAVLDALAIGEDDDPGPVTAAHGDLYEAQLLVDRGRITGLLDIDTAGAGLRVDDLANFCAHLSVLAQMSDRPRQIRRFGAVLLAHSESHHPRAVLRRRIAAAVLGLATGPFRVMEAGWANNTVRRLDLAAEWLAGADR